MGFQRILIKQLFNFEIQEGWHCRKFRLGIEEHSLHCCNGLSRKYDCIIWLARKHCGWTEQKGKVNKRNWKGTCKNTGNF